jgi:DNA-binding transcriptional LysR family regulator
MDRLAGIPAFEGVVAAGSFAGAARALGLSVAAVSKQVRALEDRLGVRLLQRTTRQVRLTEAGERFHERCQRILADLEDAEREVAERQATARGRVRVSAPMSFGQRHIGPVASAFLESHPDVAIDLVLDDRFVDLLAEGFDVAVRVAELRDSSLVARRLCASRRVLCAAPAYLAQHGAPAAPDELVAHRCIGYAYMASGCDWPFRTPGGRRLVRVHGPVMSNNGDVVRVLALDGCGIALLPTFLVADDLRDGRLREVLPDQLDGDPAVWIVQPTRRHVPLAVRAFVEFLVARFAGVAPWDRSLRKRSASSLPASSRRRAAAGTPP